MKKHWIKRRFVFKHGPQPWDYLCILANADDIDQITEDMKIQSDMFLKADKTFCTTECELVKIKDIPKKIVFGMVFIHLSKAIENAMTGLKLLITGLFYIL